MMDGALKQKRGGRGQERRARETAEAQHAATITCYWKVGQFPESVTVGGTQYWRVQPGGSLGTFRNRTNNFVYYVSRSVKTSQQTVQATYRYPHLSVHIDRDQNFIDAHWTIEERADDDEANPHVGFVNGREGFYRNPRMKERTWEDAVNAKNILRGILRNHFSLPALPDGDPD